MSLTDITQTGDCMGEALREQGKCKGRLKLTLNSDGVLAKQVIDFKIEAEAFDASPGAASLTNIAQTGDCVGDDLRGQGEG